MNHQPGMLSPYRVLDLTNERGHFAGKLLADLGADVIKVEPPQGDPARYRGPFVDDIPGPERGIRWLAWNTNKRSVTLDLSDSAGCERFQQLARSADFVLESFAPGYMDSIGLGYESLSVVNPRLILVSISPFGQSGPYRDYQVTDIVSWAMSGNMSITGESSGPPAHISDNHQSYVHAGGDAVIGSLIALEHRRQTGRGQHVDLSIQEATSRGLYQITGSWDMTGRNLPRDARPNVGEGNLSWTWQCRDGYVIWVVPIGPGAVKRLSGLFAWLNELGEGHELQSIDWENLQLEQITEDDWKHFTRLFEDVFIGRTKRELLEAAVRHDFPVPVRDRRRHARQRTTQGQRILARQIILLTSIRNLARSPRRLQSHPDASCTRLDSTTRRLGASQLPAQTNASNGVTLDSKRCWHQDCRLVVHGRPQTIKAFSTSAQTSCMRSTARLDARASWTIPGRRTRSRALRRIRAGAHWRPSDQH